MRIRFEREAGRAEFQKKDSILLMLRVRPGSVGAAFISALRNQGELEDVAGE
jgi:hypothetical protein